MEVITLLAILVGPVLAIMAGRVLEGRRDKRTRRMDIFRTLMRTRRTPIFTEHVGALNLVEIEFADDPAAVSSLRALFKHFGTVHPRREDEKTDDSMNGDELRKRDDRFFSRLGAERQALLAKLLHAIAKNLGFKIEQLEIFEGGYSPQGWEDVEREQQLIRRFMIELAFGRRSLPVAVTDYSSIDNADAK
jgi:hypothetical protein